MRREKKDLYLDSDIVAKSALFTKLIISGDSKITIDEIIAFNKTFATRAVKCLGYDSFYFAPLAMLKTTLSRFCFYNSKTQEYILNPDKLDLVMRSLEDYRNELSSNRMFISVLDNLIFDLANKVKDSKVAIIESKLSKYLSENFSEQKDSSANPYSTSFTNRELAGRMVKIYFEFFFEKKLGLNLTKTLPTTQDLKEQYERLLTQEKSFNRMLTDENLLPSDLAVIAKVIREKKFTIAKQNFLVKKLATFKKDNLAPRFTNERDVIKKPSELISDFISKYEESMAKTSEAMDEIAKSI